MSKKILWLTVSVLMVLALTTAACGTAAAPPTPTAPTPLTAPTTPSAPAAPAAPVQEKPQREAAAPAAKVPKYGGTLTLVQANDIVGFDDVVTRGVLPGATQVLTNEPVWITDWSRGKAGGYGTGEIDLFRTHDVFDLKVGAAAESWKWQVDAQKEVGSVTYTIRQGIHYALNPASEASRLVAGRELTADDVLFSLKQIYEDKRSNLFGGPIARAIKIEKTGPREITISNIPALQTRDSVRGWGDSRPFIIPPEVVKKYGDMGSWRNSVGSGPFILTDHVPGSQSVLARNPNYWMKDPVGPGKGNQLPYVDLVRYLIVPDASTREAALRTGKIDLMSAVSDDSLQQIQKHASGLVVERTDTTGPPGIGKFPIQLVQDKPPFNNVKVRQALLLATDLQAINQALFKGRGYIHTFPYEYDSAFASAYLGLDDPEMPASVKELYTYSPERAKQLLKEAGYPSGFKTTATMVAAEVDYWAILKGMWEKAGIELVFDVKADAATKSSWLRAGNLQQGMTSFGWHIPYNFYNLYLIETPQTPPGFNYGVVRDSKVDEAMAQVRRVYFYDGDTKKATGMAKELWKYILGQVFAIPVPYGPVYTVWWPWLANYSGESTMGFHYFNRWTGFVWIDRDLKKKMGY